eukprot:gnl/TRDRNA2_/TRDRNA2_42004_c0_seq1.p1 gnl/TRDRNA2_/TRDRNA2_42004_c0~~gnl/TRDRNA2_/TRDRNA2_42004_c0_seq1.p1  ORF type:complete len:270 (+),score=49.21 gnl/TRDRNA2_/TRDRNA2_42004_c0_seq1:25-810(+)
MHPDELAVLEEPAMKVGEVPPEVRTDFVKKVYGLVIAMLLITFGIASPFVFYSTEARVWVQKYLWVVIVAFVVLLFIHIYHFMMICEMCCGGTKLRRQYLTMFRTVPWNFLYMLVYAIVLGVVMGVICLSYTATSVCFVFLLSAVLIVALTCYAIYTSADFTGFGAYMLVALVGLMMMVFIGFFVPVGSVYHRIIGAIGAIIFGCIIVYDTQLIFGDLRKGEEGEEVQLQYTIDMYAYAAMELYLDFINFFLYMLRFLGDR